MSVEKTEIETYFGRCRCCLSYGYLKNMWEEHHFKDEPEIYGEMLVQCFALTWDQSEDAMEQDQICEQCITRLRDANDFKKVVLESQEELLLQIDAENTETVKEESLEEDYVIEYKGPESEADTEYTMDTADAAASVKDETEYEEIEYLEDEEAGGTRTGLVRDAVESDSSLLSEPKRPVKRRKQPRQPDTDDEDGPKRKWPKKLPKSERQKTYKQYSEGDLRKCLEEVRNNVITAGEAATKYNIPKKTICAKIKMEPKDVRTKILDSTNKATLESVIRRKIETTTVSYKDPDTDTERCEEPGTDSEKQEEPDKDAKKHEEPDTDSEKQEEPDTDTERREQLDTYTEKQEEPDKNTEKHEEPDTDSDKQEEPDKNTEKHEEPDTDSEKQEEPDKNTERHEEPDTDSEKQEEPDKNTEKHEEPDTDSEKQEEPDKNTEKHEEPDTDSDKQEEPDKNTEKHEEPDTDSEKQEEPNTYTERREQLDKNTERREEPDTDTEKQEEPNTYTERREQLDTYTERREEPDTDTERREEPDTYTEKQEEPDTDGHKASKAIGEKTKENKYEMLKHKNNLKMILKYSTATIIKGHTTAGYSCWFCDNVFSPNKLKQHNFEHGDLYVDAIKVKYVSDLIMKLDVTGLKCRLCEERIDSLEELMEHLQVNHNKTIYTDIDNHFIPFKFDTVELRCAICHTKFKFFKTLSEHMSGHYGNYKCSECDRVFINKQSMQVHSYRHKKGEYKCPECPKAFNTYMKARDHKYVTHKLCNKKRRCGFCDERFPSSDMVRNHETKIHGVVRFNPSCDICDKTFASENTLATHKKRHHLFLRGHQCDTCGMRFYSRQELDWHSVVHTKRRKFRCNECGNFFGTKPALNQHLRAHRDIKKYKCDFCDMSFTHISTWSIHVMLKHRRKGRS